MCSLLVSPGWHSNLISSLDRDTRTNFSLPSVPKFLLVSLISSLVVRLKKVWWCLSLAVDLISFSHFSSDVLYLSTSCKFISLLRLWFYFKVVCWGITAYKVALSLLQVLSQTRKLVRWRSGKSHRLPVYESKEPTTIQITHTDVKESSSPPKLNPDGRSARNG